MKTMPSIGLMAKVGEQPERAETGEHQVLAIGEIHDARDAVLQRQPDGDQRIGAAENDTGNQDFHNADDTPDYPARRRPRRVYG